MKASYIDYTFGILLFVLIVFPPCFNMVLETSSFSSGVALALLVFLYCYAVIICGTSYSSKWPVGYLVSTLPIVVAIYLHGAVCAFLFDAFDISRFIQSSVLMYLFVFGALSIFSIVKSISNDQMAFAGKILFYALLVTGILGVLKFSPFVDSSNAKVVVFFGEPSHYAISFLPSILFIVVVSKPKLKLFWLFLCAVIALFLQNLSFLIGLGFISFVIFPLRKFLIILLISILAISTINTQYYSSRINVSKGTTNLSTLVWLQGWENAYLNFIDTNGLGVGFQQFGFIGRRGIIGQTIYDIVGRDLNLTDGGSAGSKFIGEFGMLGVVVMLVYLVHSVSIARWLRKVAQGCSQQMDYKAIFFKSFFLMFIIELFVRSTGYFTSTGLLFLASLLWIFTPKLRGFISFSSLRFRFDKA